MAVVKSIIGSRLSALAVRLRFDFSAHGRSIYGWPWDALLILLEGGEGDEANRSMCPSGGVFAGGYTLMVLMIVLVERGRIALFLHTRLPIFEMEEVIRKA